MKSELEIQAVEFENTLTTAGQIVLPAQFFLVMCLDPSDLDSAGGTGRATAVRESEFRR